MPLLPPLNIHCLTDSRLAYPNLNHFKHCEAVAFCHRDMGRFRDNKRVLSIEHFKKVSHHIEKRLARCLPLVFRLVSSWRGTLQIAMNSHIFVLLRSRCDCREQGES
jgi:hypothetical protein